MGHTYTKIAIHALFATKGRKPWLGSDIRPRLFGYLAGIARHLGAKPIIIGGYSDHVHVVFLLPAILPLADFMEKLKANSSKWLHEESPALRHFAWQTGYTAFSVSQSNLKRVSDYVAEQEQHHAKTSYLDEVMALLENHGIQPDAEYQP